MVPSPRQITPSPPVHMMPSPGQVAPPSQASPQIARGQASPQMAHTQPPGHLTIKSILNVPTIQRTINNTSVKPDQGMFFSEFSLNFLREVSQSM